MYSVSSLCTSTQYPLLRARTAAGMANTMETAKHLVIPSTHVYPNPAAMAAPVHAGTNN